MATLKKELQAEAEAARQSKKRAADGEDMCVNMRVDMCIDMCVDMWVDMWVDM